MSDKTSITVWVPEDLKSWLQEHKDKTRFSMTETVIRALEEYRDKYERIEKDAAKQF